MLLIPTDSLSRTCAPCSSGFDIEMANPPTPFVFDSNPKSLVDTQPEDLELFKLRDKIDVDKCAIRIRLFQPEDAEQVRELSFAGFTVGR